MTQPRILLSTPNVAYEQRIRQAFGGTLNGELRWFRDAADSALLARQAVDSGADVVAVGPDIPVADALSIARTLDHERPEVSVILVAPPSPDLYQRALRAGVRDVLAPDALDAEVREVFERALEVTQRRRDNVTAGEPTSAGGKVITVLSPKGGSGKTTVATNLALGLAEAARGKVVLVDLDLQFGDAASGLGLVPEHTIADAARAVNGLDALTLKVFLTPHPSDLYTLCAPESPAEGEEVTAQQVTQVLQVLSAEFTYVIVDTPAGLGEHTLSAVECATDLVLVCSMDVPSVRGLRKEVLALDQLGMSHQTRHFVLNRADSRVGLDAGDVEATVGLPVHVSLSSTRAIPVSVNQGAPVITSEPRSPAARQLRELVGRFAEKPSSDQHGGFPWRRKDRT
ncbi:MAG: AAA family ATPase [Actinomycetota bacterium]|nr:AAA family ATPase [Actinomycetota bacterium]